MGNTKKTDNTTFAEKHPCLNVLISLLLLLVLVAVIGCLLYGAAKYIIIGTKSGVDWLASLTSKLDAVVIVALITGSVSIIGVLISSVVAKRMSIRKVDKNILQKREKSLMGNLWI